MDQYIQFVDVNDEDNQLSSAFLAELKTSQSAYASVDYTTTIQDAVGNHGIKMNFYKPKDEYEFKEKIYGIILSSHVDYELEMLAKKYMWPRGFPIIWYPDQKRIKFFGFRPKFKNDQRQKKTDVENVDGFAYFPKWSGFLGQPITLTIDGNNYWAFASKNSLNSQQKDSKLMNFVEDGARIMAPHMTSQFIDHLVQTGKHILVEVLSKNDQKHGARVLKEGAIVTTLATGVDLYLAKNLEVNPPEKKKGFNTYHGFMETIRFSRENNLLVGPAVFATGTAAKELLKLFNENRDDLYLQRHNTILDTITKKYPDGITVEEGTTDHETHLGFILEGLVLHIVNNSGNTTYDSIKQRIEDGSTHVEKFKLPPYVVRTMAIRPALTPEFKLRNFPQLLDRWGDMWCVNPQYKVFWKKFAWQVMIHYKEYQEKSNPQLTAYIVSMPMVELHITLCDYVKEHGVYADLDDVILKYQSSNVIIEGCHVVVIPFADKTRQKTIADKFTNHGLEVTFGKTPKKANGWVKITTIPTKPDESMARVYEFNLTETEPKKLLQWQQDKLATTSSCENIVRVSSVDEVIQNMKSCIRDERSEPALEKTTLSDTEMAIRNACQTAINTIKMNVAKNQDNGKRTIVLLIAPQCFGKTWITEILMKRGDFMDASADKHIGPVFNMANLEKAHKKCRQTVFDAVHYDGLNVVVDNTNIHPEHRTLYATMADVLGAVYLPVIVGPELWFNTSETQRAETCSTLFARSQARGALTSKVISQDVIAKTIKSAESSFVAHTKTALTVDTEPCKIQQWLNMVPQSDLSGKMGFNIDSMTLKFRSSNLTEAGIKSLENEEIHKNVDELKVKRLFYEISRGQNDFYTTIISPSEMKKTRFMKTPHGKNPKSIIIGGEPIVKGVGRLLDTHTNKEVIFMVIEWNEAQEFRKSLELEPKDFHVTLAFKNDDIHDQRKNEVLWH